MSRNVGIVIAVVLGLIIVALLAVLLFVPAPVPPTDEDGDTNDTPQLAKKGDIIVVMTPTPNAIINSPVTIEGEARGPWYFEASFGVKVLDFNGELLGQAPAEADGEWMTTEFVPFHAEVDFTSPVGNSGFIVLEKANPSGLPENEDELRFPVNFK